MPHAKDRQIIKKQLEGLTLIEFLLALTLSLLLLGVVTTIYIAAQKNFNFQASLALLQENANFASEMLRSEIKNAGYIGCAKLTDDFPLISLPHYEINPRNKISMTKNTITVRHVQSVHTNLIKNMKNNSSFSTGSSPVFKSGDIALISDCQAAEIIEIKHATLKNQVQTLTATQPLHKLYEANTEVGLFAINTFFIADTGRKSESGGALYALYQSDVHQRKIELVEGVEALAVDLNKQGAAVSLKLTAPLLTKTWLFYVAIN